MIINFYSIVCLVLLLGLHTQCAANEDFYRKYFKSIEFNNQQVAFTFLDKNDRVEYKITHNQQSVSKINEGSERVTLKYGDAFELLGIYYMRIEPYDMTNNTQQNFFPEDIAKNAVRYYSYINYDLSKYRGDVYNIHTYIITAPDLRERYQIYNAITNKYSKRQDIKIQLYEDRIEVAVFEFNFWKRWLLRLVDYFR